MILDIGYGSFGAQVLNLVEGAEEEQDLNVYAVISYRQTNDRLPDIVDHVRSLARVDGLINNSHLERIQIWILSNRVL